MASSRASTPGSEASTASDGLGALRRAVATPPPRPARGPAAGPPPGRAPRLVPAREELAQYQQLKLRLAGGGGGAGGAGGAGPAQAGGPSPPGPPKGRPEPVRGGPGPPAARDPSGGMPATPEAPGPPPPGRRRRTVHLASCTTEPPPLGPSPPLLPPGPSSPPGRAAVLTVLTVGAATLAGGQVGALEPGGRRAAAAVRPGAGRDAGGGPEHDHGERVRAGVPRGGPQSADGGLGERVRVAANAHVRGEEEETLLGEAGEQEGSSEGEALENF